MRYTAVSLVLLGLLLAFSQSSEAGDKIKIEIVEATSTVQTLSSGRIHLMFDAKAILPDGSHTALTCLAGDNDCAGIVAIVPEKSTSDCGNTSEDVFVCVNKNLGTYEAKRSKNDLVIYGPKGKLKYHIVGSW